jgi:queuine tRNA-ribosyltransferase
VTSTIDLQHGQLTLPVYMPDSTQAVVRSVDSIDLEAVKIQSVVMNAFHLMQHPGSMTVQSLGGLHRMAGWEPADHHRFRWVPGVFPDQAELEVRPVG